MMQEDGLADATRTHQYNGAPNVGLRRQLQESLEVRTPLHAGVVIADPRAVPPRVLGSHPAPHLLLGDSAHGARLPARAPADQVKKADFLYPI
ncbi:MAG: hypothetical protein OXH69_02730 [Acidobacteria bacterium]|nr:hypothetical protein [Acidobacteriota bacterium]